MSDESESKPTETPTNTVSISIEEFNKLQNAQKKISDYEQKLLDGNTAFEALQNDYESLKSQGKPKVEKVNRDEIEASVRKEWGEKLTAAEKQAQGLQNKLKTRLVTDKVMDELRKNKLLPDAEEYIRRDIAEMCDLEGDDYDNGNIIVKDKNGETRWSAINQGQKMTYQELANELVATKPSFFESNVIGGVEGTKGGASKGGSTSSNDAPLTWQQFQRMTPEQQKGLSPQQLDSLMKQPRNPFGG